MTKLGTRATQRSIRETDFAALRLGPARRPPASRRDCSRPTPSRSTPSPCTASRSSPPDFQHFPYVNPDAPKGGRVTLATSGSFDSLNPLIVRGEPVQGTREFVIESLMARGQDEPFTLYGLIAETIDVPPGRGEVTFRINPKARFSDGKPVTADDVIFSHALLKEKARPNYRTYYKKVSKVERLSDLEVRFVLAEGDREMPLILGLMPVLPKHAVDPETFEATSLVPPIGSGPYRIGRIDPGRSITYERDPNYWGRDLPVNRGRFNFDEIRFEYFRDASTQFEAFKTGPDRHPQRGRSGAVGARLHVPRGDRRSRHKGRDRDRASGGHDGARLQHAPSAVRRSARARGAHPPLQFRVGEQQPLPRSLQAHARASSSARISRRHASPPTSGSGRCSRPIPIASSPAILDGTYRPAGKRRLGAQSRECADRLRAPGGRPATCSSAAGSSTRRHASRFSFEILASNPGQERLVGSFKSDLEKLGIAVRVRVVDSAQYQSRLKDYDFDMIQFTWPSSLSPGNEQLFRWSSAVAVAARVLQLRGRPEPGRRRDDRRAARRRVERGVRIRRARARPRASLGRLRDPAFLRAEAVGRLLGASRTTPIRSRCSVSISTPGGQRMRPREPRHDPIFACDLPSMNPPPEPPRAHFNMAAYCLAEAARANPRQGGADRDRRCGRKDARRKSGPTAISRTPCCGARRRSGRAGSRRAIAF